MKTEILNLSKSEKSEFKLDGILSESELNNAVELDVKYEHDPGYNESPSYKTMGYLKYSETFLYVGFRSYKDNVTASIHSRDNPSIYQDDVVMINLDTYGDARNNLGFVSNLYGSQSDGVRVEGGDVMLMGSEVWVGIGDSEDFDKFRTARTNEEAINWLKEEFPSKTIISFALSKSDIDPRLNALHLDCCLSPLGLGHAIFHPEGMKNKRDREFIRKTYSDKIIEVDAESMYHMHCNLFSISPTTVISGEGFDRVNAQLRDWGYRVIETPMNETSKMEGLIRCVTLPIQRS